jgi:rubrerythrin
MSDAGDALDRVTVCHAWRLACEDCGHTWRGRSAEAHACPECDSWAIVSAVVDVLDGVDDA